VGLTPTGKRRLCTAHTQTGRQAADNDCSIAFSKRHRAPRLVGPDRGVAVAAEAAEFAANIDHTAIPKFHVEAGHKAGRPALQKQGRRRNARHRRVIAGEVVIVVDAGIRRERNRRCPLQGIADLGAGAGAGATDGEVVDGLRDAEAVGVGGVMFPQRMPRREVFNLAGPSSFGSYMKMLASISNKYHRQQSCSSPESLPCARRDHPMRRLVHRCIDRASHLNQRTRSTSLSDAGGWPPLGTWRQLSRCNAMFGIRDRLRSRNRMNSKP
jgi:hypothetical protein